MDALVEQAYDLAVAARSNAYAPISQFSVGASLIADGKIYAGCNVEDGAFTSSIHAEQNALGQMIASDGKQSISHLIVVGDDVDSNPCFPCGHCLQLLSDFVEDPTKVLVFNPDKTKRFDGTYKDLVPYGFRFSN